MQIRAARPSDKRAVREFLSRIWDDDYVLEVFDDWVRDRRGRLWVAVEDGRAVAIAKLTLLGDREAWLHALRVDPEYQRRGIAGALLEHRLARARRLGARVARLDTSEDNVAVRRLMQRYRFREVERVNYWWAPPLTTDRPRQARRRDLDHIWRLGRGLLLHGDYTARALTRSDVAAAMRTRDCYVVGDPPRAFAIAVRQRGSRRVKGSRLRVRVLTGPRAATRELAKALRGEARHAHVERAAIAPRSPLWPVMRAAGYRERWHDAMLVFERRL